MILITAFILLYVTFALFLANEESRDDPVALYITLVFGPVLAVSMILFKDLPQYVIWRVSHLRSRFLNRSPNTLKR